jgi:hypothetical protein
MNPTTTATATEPTAGMAFMAGTLSKIQARVDSAGAVHVYLLA